MLLLYHVELKLSKLLTPPSSFTFSTISTCCLAISVTKELLTLLIIKPYDEIKHKQNTTLYVKGVNFDGWSFRSNAACVHHINKCYGCLCVVRTSWRNFCSLVWTANLRSFRPSKHSLGLALNYEKINTEISWWLMRSPCITLHSKDNFLLLNLNK